jgi:hypothetical protein
MNLVLLAVGLLATAGGFVAIGFGIPINAFSLGNTLIIAGTVAAGTGLIVIGLAAAIGQLRRIAEALNARPLARGGRGAETVETLVPPSPRMTPVAPPPPSPVPTRMPKPPEMRDARMPEPPAPELPQLEPRFPAAAQNEPPGPLDWLRTSPKPAGSPMPSPYASNPPEPPVVEVSDEAPLSPRPPQRQPMPPMPPMTEPALEPKIWSPGRGSGPAEPRPMSRPEAPMPRATPQPEQPKEKEDFNLVWPDRTPGAPAGDIAKRETPFETLPLPSRLREARNAERRSEPAPKPAPERGPAILKSGVIDGMPYTLYADGSIEAELPHGTVKFASVDALRAHLEKQG